MTKQRHQAKDSGQSFPKVGLAPAPIWLFVLLGMLMFWGMGFLEERAGGFNPNVYEPYHSYDQLQALLPKSDDDVLFTKGMLVYNIYCSVCHQPTGQGLAGQFPPLAESDWVQTEGANRLIRLVLDGIQGPIQVNGQAFNGAMPPWRDLLTDEDIASVLTYVRQNEGWGNSAAAVLVEEVTALREETVGHSTAWSPEDLLALPDSN